MKEELEQRVEHWGAELAFARAFLGARGRRVSRHLLFWSDWSGLKHRALCRGWCCTKEMPVSLGDQVAGLSLASFTG